jgi:uncharacterized protein (DUF488 family)
MSESLFTLGHSTHSLEVFLELLTAHKIRRLADIRTVPGSRRHPQFGKEELEKTLKAHGIGYLHISELGGLRRPRKDSINTAWRNASFRGYADHMQTPDFARGLDILLEAAGSARTVMMCAEAVPWRCHRSLVADALTARGIEVRHIMSRTKADPHKLTPFARVEGTKVTYPGLDALET